MARIARLFETTALFASFGALIGACSSSSDGPDELKSALPERSTLLVDFPDATSGESSQGLTATTPSGLVGQPAEFYTTTYYQAREVNLFLKSVFDILEAVTQHPPSAFDSNSAVWGPFSDERDPHEYRLSVVRHEEANLYYAWALEGKHKSVGEDAFAVIASGATEPDFEPYGRGWLSVDFEVIHLLNPVEDTRGMIWFAYAKNPSGTAVSAYYQREGADPAKAGYVYGESAAGGGYILFAVQHDIDENQDPNRTAQEDVLVRTRWSADRRGRADVIAVHGDLGSSSVTVSQCWDNSFVSAYESVRIDGTLSAESGDSALCVFEETMLPEAEDLPENAEFLR